MAEYEYRPVRRSTADYLSESFVRHFKREPTNGCLYLIGRKTYTMRGGVWFLEVRPRAKRPAYRSGTLYGAFTVAHTGHNFVVWKTPGAVNWHKVVVPALRRLVREITGQPSTRTEWWVDGLEVGEFDRLRGPAKYELQGGRFVMVHKGRKAK